MGCCKEKKTKINDVALFEEANISIGTRVFNLTLRVILFTLLSVVISLVIIPISLVVLFRIVVLSKHINLIPLIKYLGNKLLTEKEEIEEDEDEEDEDYELDNPNEIIVLNKN